MSEESSISNFHLLAAAPPEEVPDEVVEKALMDVIVGSEEDIRKILGILKRTRPELLKNLEKLLPKASR